MIDSAPVARTQLAGRERRPARHDLFVVPKQRPLAVALASEDGVPEARVKWRPRQAMAARVRLTDLSDQVLGRECARHRVRRRLLARTRAHVTTVSRRDVSQLDFRRRTLAQADIGLSGARGGCPLQQRPSSQLATLHASQSSCIGWTTCHSGLRPQTGSPRGRLDH